MFSCVFCPHRRRRRDHHHHHHHNNNNNNHNHHHHHCRHHHHHNHYHCDLIHFISNIVMMWYVSLSTINYHIHNVLTLICHELHMPRNQLLLQIISHLLYIPYHIHVKSGAQHMRCEFIIRKKIYINVLMMFKFIGMIFL